MKHSELAVENDAVHELEACGEVGALPKWAAAKKRSSAVLPPLQPAGNSFLGTGPPARQVTLMAGTSAIG